MGMDGPTLDECLEMGKTCACYNLRRAARAVTQVFDTYFDEIGLRATQFTVLAALAWSGQTPPTVTELADALVLEQSSLSRNLAVLERKGLVKLVPGADRRERIVTLTRTGRATLAKGYPLWKKAQATIAEAVDPKELEVQLRSLRRMTRSAQAVRPESPRPPRSASRSARSAV
jgi:DNA-binding MarR family transcriptional regulator